LLDKNAKLGLPDTISKVILYEEPVLKLTDCDTPEFALSSKIALVPSVDQPVPKVQSCPTSFTDTLSID
jgi:hypothetical protein